MSQESSSADPRKNPPPPGREEKKGPVPGGEEKSTRRVQPGKVIPPFSGLLDPASFEEKKEEIKEEFSLPRSFGNYILLEKLGRGGMGVVFLAEDQVLKRKVALKILRQETLLFQVEARERFQREAQAAARLDHPGICPVYEVGEVDGLPFMAMRYVPGRTLAEEIARAKKEGRPPDKGAVMDLVKLGEKVARTLHAAHEAGLVHRDIKPANLMIDPEGNPVLLDFGLARETAPSARELTQTLAVLGTPHYLPPERFDGKKAPPDLRGDVYSLAATLFEALTLECPFEGDTLEELSGRIRTGRHPDPRSLNPAVPRDLALVLAKAMDKNPARRYETALEFAEDLRRVRTYEPVQVRPAGPLLKTARWAQRNPILATSLAGIFLALLVGFLSTYFLLHKVRSAFIEARAMGLLTASKEALPRSARLSLLLAMESYRLRPRGEALSQVLQALAENPETASIPAPFPAQGGNGVLAVSPGGRFLLLPSSRGTLDLWDAEGRKRLSFPAEEVRRVGEKTGILALSFSPGGDSFLAAGWDGLLLWNLEGKKLLALGRPGKGEFPSDEHLRNAWFSRDGKKLLLFLKNDKASTATLQVRTLGGRILWAVTIPYSGSQAYGFQPFPGIFWFIPRKTPGGKPPRLHAWDLEGKPVSFPWSFPLPLSWAGFSPRGGFFAWIFRRKDAKGRELYGYRVRERRGRAVLEPPPSPGKIRFFCFSPDEKRIAYVRREWTVAVRRLDGEGAGTRWIAHNQEIRLLAFSPGGRHILTGSLGGEMALWNLEGKKVMDFRGHEAGIRKGGFLGPRAFFSFSEDGTVRIWRTQTRGTPFFEVGPDTNKPFFFRSHGDTLFLIGPGGRIGKWSPEGRFLGTLAYPGVKPFFLYGHPKTGTMILSSRDNRPRLWDPKEGKWFVLPRVRGVLIAACFGPKGRRFGVSLGRVRGQTPGFFLFSRPGGAPKLLFHKDILSNVLQFSPTGDKILLSGGYKKGIFLLDQEGEALARGLAGKTCRLAAFLEGGRKIAVYAVQEGVFLLDRAGNVLAHYKETPYVNSLQPSPGGKSFLYASPKGLLLVRDSLGRILLRYRECEGPIRSAAFSPSGRKILEAAPKALKILDASSGKVLLSFHTRKSIWRVGFTPSGKRAWILFQRGLGLRVLPLETGAILDLAAKAAERGFTREEREAYRTLLEGD